MSFESFNPPPDSPERKPEKRVHQVKLPENTRQQEFFATETGTVAGRDNLELLEAKVGEMLADREKSIAGIEINLNSVLKKLLSQKKTSEQGFKVTMEEPGTFNAELIAREKKEQEKIIKEIEMLLDLTQKLETNSLSQEEANLIVTYLPPHKRIVTRMFLTRLSGAQQEQKVNSVENQLREPKHKINSTAINREGANPEKKESPDNFTRIKIALNNYAEEVRDYQPNQSNSMTVAIEGFKLAYPEENSYLSRIKEVSEIYKIRLQEELKTYPENKRGMYASNRAMEYIMNSVLTRQERVAFEKIFEKEKQRMSAIQGMRMQLSTPLGASLKDLFKVITG